MRMMRIVLLSDTHNQHGKIKVPDGDILIHAGDATSGGTYEEVDEFFHWFRRLPHQHKVFVAGNHDWLFQKEKTLAALLSDGITYLEDSWEMVGGFKIYGSPWQPEFCNWAFNLPRNGFLLEAAWKQIPDDTDILVTHGPPYGILDTVDMEGSQGCERLRARFGDYINPELHVFGHIHEGYGTYRDNDLSTIFVNASICSPHYEPINKPIVVGLTDNGLQILEEE